MGAAVGAIGAILGHNYTFWLGFKGGKGIATSAGAMIALIPWAVLAAVTVWLIVFYAKRYVSLASICASVTIPSAIIIQGLIQGSHELPLLVLGLVVGGMGVWRHRANIERLWAGTEDRMGKPKS